MEPVPASFVETPELGIVSKITKNFYPDSRSSNRNSCSNGFELFTAVNPNMALFLTTAVCFDLALRRKINVKAEMLSLVGQND